MMSLLPASAPSLGRRSPLSVAVSCRSDSIVIFAARRNVEPEAARAFATTGLLAAADPQMGRAKLVIEGAGRIEDLVAGQCRRRAHALATVSAPKKVFEWIRGFGLKRRIGNSRTADPGWTRNCTIVDSPARRKLSWKEPRTYWRGESQDSTPDAAVLRGALRHGARSTSQTSMRAGAICASSSRALFRFEQPRAVRVAPARRMLSQPRRSR
jgi:hypothetical protein